MNDEIWAAFSGTPAPIEPVANKDNSLQGFQRRLLGECGEQLKLATEAMTQAQEILTEQGRTIDGLRFQLDELRTRYDVLTDRAIEADRLLGQAFHKLYSAQYSQLVPYGIGDLLEEMGAYWDA